MPLTVRAKSPRNMAVSLSARQMAFISCCMAQAAAAQAHWRIDPKPLLDVAEMGRDSANFEIPGGATRLRDGRLMLVDRGTLSIRIFDPSGKLINVSGRSGQGPSEFGSMMWSGRCGPDTLLIWDARLGRFSMVGPDGNVAHQVTFNPVTDKTGRPWTWSCGPNGTLSFLSEEAGVRSDVATGVRRGMLPGDAMLPHRIKLTTGYVATVTRDGQLIKSYGQFNNGEWYIPGRGEYPRPLGAQGSIIYVGSNLVVGSGDTAALTILTTTGERRTVMVPARRRPPTRAEFDAAVIASGSIAPNEWREYAIKGLSFAPVPTLLPAYAALFAAPSGFVWVQLTPSESKQVELLGIQLDGHVVARMQLPGPFTIYEIGTDYIVGSYVDANEAYHVTVYRLRSN